MIGFRIPNSANPSRSFGCVEQRRKLIRRNLSVLRVNNNITSYVGRQNQERCLKDGNA
jgi:hypothetical protein